MGGLKLPLAEWGCVRVSSGNLRGIFPQPADIWLADGACRGCPVAMNGIFMIYSDEQANATKPGRDLAMFFSRKPVFGT